MKSFTMNYGDGRIIDGAEHPQIDSGFGFTCDEEMLDLVIALHAAGMPTMTCCQAQAYSFLVPRRFVAFANPDTVLLLRFCEHIRSLIDPAASAWSQRMVIDHFYKPSGVFAQLDFTPNLDSQILAAVRAWSVET